ncbi:MAG TPA: DUF4386 domain-containing protein [Steroidobacteraceae bacterium]|jgi:hypothetical protein
MKHPRLLARIAGAFYLVITACALFAYLYVRDQVIDVDDMARTAANLVAHEQLYRLGFAAAVIVVICNLPMGFILTELLEVVNERIARLALVFIVASATLEAVNLANYIEPLFAVSPVPIRMWSYAFSVSLTFFGVYCALIGVLVLRSGFLPRVLGVLLIACGATYWSNAFRLFLALPIPYIQWVTLVGENALALWLLIVGLDEARWRERAAAYNPAR